MVMMVVVVVVVFVMVVMLVTLDHRNHKPRAPGHARRLLLLQAWQCRGHGWLLLGVGLRRQQGFGWGHGLAGFRPQPFAVAVLQGVLVVAGELALVW